MKFIVSVIIALSLMQINAKAQKVYVTDSIYYFVDTAHVNARDRLISIYDLSFGVRCFEIACPCMKYGQNPIFRYVIKDKGKTISANEMKKIKLVNLTYLLKKIHLRTEVNFDEIQVYQVIEPEGDHFKMHQVGFLPQSPPTNSDYIPTVKRPY